MSRLTVIIDKDDKDVQVYGTHRYNTDTGWLYKKSARKVYLDVLSKNRTEENIKDAIKNYNSELDDQISKIKKQYA